MDLVTIERDIKKREFCSPSKATEWPIFDSEGTFQGLSKDPATVARIRK
jgi:hypothetical protein